MHDCCCTNENGEHVRFLLFEQKLTAAPPSLLVSRQDDMKSGVSDYRCDYLMIGVGPSD
jgi:hypothetical protein